MCDGWWSSANAVLFVLALIWNCNLLAKIAPISVFLITSVMSKENPVKCLSTCFADQKLVENSFCTWKRGCKIYLKGDKFLGYLNRHSWTSAIWSFHITNCCNSFFKNILQRFPRVTLFKKVTCQVQFRYWILRKTKQRSKQSFHHPNPQVNFRFS